MGTNYYHRNSVCKCCGRFDERHIGKSSGGWQFSFRGYSGDDPQKTIESWADWQRVLQADGDIVDEYGREVPFVELRDLVERKRAGENHYDFCAKNGY